MIDNIVDHKKNTGLRHLYIKAAEPLYCVRWFGYEAENDTSVPTRHLPRGKIQSYFQKKNSRFHIILNKPKTADQQKFRKISFCLDD